MAYVTHHSAQVMTSLSKAIQHPREFVVGSQCNVKVTHILNTKLFFIRPLSKTLEKNLKLLECPGERILAEEIVLGDILVYQSRKIGKFIRGIVSEMDIYYYTFFALDYGFYENLIELINIMRPRHIINVPSQATKCLLLNFNDDQYKNIPNLIDHMNKIVGLKSRIVIRKNKCGVLSVDLYSYNNPDDIATLLTRFCIAHEDSLPEPEGTVPTYKIKTLKEGATELVRVLSGETIRNFSVAVYVDYRKDCKSVDYMTDYARSQDPLNPEQIEVGKAVIVQCRKSYQTYVRGLIMEVNENKTVVCYLVDSGITINDLSFENIRPIRSRYTEKTTLAVNCSGDPKESWRNNIDKLIFPGSEFYITVLSVGKTFKEPTIVRIKPK